jgi:hydrogenase nickel incorporation protein HypA/HybF
MHEASLCDALFDQVDGSLAAYPGATVRAVHVAIGELAGVDPELFAIAFDTLRLDRHPDAILALNHVPARWLCPDCGDERGAPTPLTCPSCESPLVLSAGGDLTLLRLELELPQAREVPDV